MSAAPKLRFSPEAYLEWEEMLEEKHEYYDGEVFAMAGGTADHALIIGNLFAEFRARLRPRGCTVFTEAMRVHVAARGLYTYPDLSVVCGPPAYLDARRTTLTNPTALVEVLSPSTRSYDEGARLDFYLSLESLRAYLVVDTEEPSARLVWRTGDTDDWRFNRAHGLDAVLTLPPLGVDLPLAEAYEGVTFPVRDSRAS